MISIYIITKEFEFINEIIPVGSLLIQEDVESFHLLHKDENLIESIPLRGADFVEIMDKVGGISNLKKIYTNES